MTDNDHSHGGVPCDDPRCQGPLADAETSRRIEQYGFAITGVFPDDEEGEPGFVYTCGMSEKGLFDLIFIGDCSNPATYYVSEFARLQLQGHVLPEGEMPADHPLNPFDVRINFIHAVGRLETHAFGVTTRLEQLKSEMPERLMQVVMCDKQGLMPWEPGYAWLDQDMKVDPTPTLLH